MRIFVASGIFHPESGGPATYLYHLLPQLQERGHDLTVLSFGNAPSNGYSYPLTRIPRRRYLQRQWDYFRASARLWPGHDLAYIHSLGLPLASSIRPRVGKIVGDIAWERAMNRGWIPANTDVDEFQSASYHPQVQINKVLRAREARNLACMIVPSQYLKQVVVGWGVPSDRIRVIYNSVEPFRGNSQSMSQSEARKQIGLPDVPIFFTAARLTAWKGVDHCIRALAACFSHDACLVIAGDGEMLPTLQALAAELRIEDRVFFLHHIPRDRIPLYFRAADYTVLYSGYEGLSHVLLESLQAGTPIIASDKGGNPEVVQHGINGLLVPYVNIDALIAAFDEALIAGQREQLAANACLDTARFSPQKMVDQTEAVLKEVAGV